MYPPRKDHPMDTCAMFGHNWVVMPVKGRLVEMCAACKAQAEEA